MGINIGESTKSKNLSILSFGGGGGGGGGGGRGVDGQWLDRRTRPNQFAPATFLKLGA